jgi:hypothetical protein
MSWTTCAIHARSTSTRKVWKFRRQKTKTIWVCLSKMGNSFQSKLKKR